MKGTNMTDTKTCMQQERDRYLRPIMRRRPHVPDWERSDCSPGSCDYVECKFCRGRIYAQRPDTDYASAMRAFVGGDE